MSATDRIRDAIGGSDDLLVRIPRRQAAALCDVADAAREGHTCGSTGPWRCPVCAALARLDRDSPNG